MESPDGGDQGKGAPAAGGLSLLSEEKLEEDDNDVSLWRDNHRVGSNPLQPNNGSTPYAARTPETHGHNTPSRPGTEVVDISSLTDDQLIELFAQLPPDMLAQRKKALQDWALHLGLEEAREMQRGRLLNILTPKHASSPNKP